MARMPRQYLVDPILPVHEIHLLGGPSGAGKSRWLFQTLLDWEQGLPVLDYPSHPVPWVYVASDRSLASVCRTFASMGLLQTIQIIPAWDKGLSFNMILDAIKEQGAQFAVIESFGSFVDPPGNSACVKKFLQPIGRYCRNNDLTILGVMESPKMKPYERYDNPRQRISGAAGWGHFTETIFLMEPADVKDAENRDRIFTLCPRNGTATVINYTFDERGRLLLSTLPLTSEELKAIKKRSK
jgi:hypothetical protein